MAIRKRKARRRRAQKAKRASPVSRLLSSLPFDPGLLGLWLLLVLPPLVLLPGIADGFRLPKLVVSEALALFACILLVLRRGFGRGSGEQRGSGEYGLGGRREPLRPLAWLRSPAVLATLPLVVVSLVGLAVGEHGVFVRRTLPSFLVGMVFLWTVATCTTSEERRRFLRAWSLPALALAVLGLVQALDLWEPLALVGATTDRLAVTSLAGGAFDLAAYLLVPALLSQERAFARSGRWRVAWITVAVILSAALLATQTVAVLGAFVLGSAYLWWRLLPRRRAVAALAVIVVLAVAALTLVAPLRSRMEKKVEQLGDGEINAFLTGRIDGWRGALWMAEEEPWTGVGLGAYRSEFGHARLALQEQGVHFYPFHRQPYFVNAHSDPLEVLAEWGLPGLLALLWGGWVLFRRVEGPALQASLASLVLVSLTNFPFHLALVAYPWLVLLAEVFDGRRETETEPEAEPEPAAGEETSEPGVGGPALPARSAGFVLAVALTVALIVVMGHGRDRIGAERLTRMAESVVVQASRAGGLPPRALDTTLGMLRRARELDPAQVSVPMTRGGLYLLGERWSAAERAFRQALELEYRPEIWANLARVHLGEGDREAALAAGRMAVRLHPRKARELAALPELLQLARKMRRGEALGPAPHGGGEGSGDIPEAPP